MCDLCKTRDLTLWNGDKPKCAFDNRGNFTSDNWNCATMNKLREMVDDNAIYSNDSYSALIPIEYENEINDDFVYANFILLNWYKRRGRTDLAKIITSGNQIKDLTLDIAKHTINNYSKH